MPAYLILFIMTEAEKLQAEGYRYDPNIGAWIRQGRGSSNDANWNRYVNGSTSYLSDDAVNKPPIWQQDPNVASGNYDAWRHTVNYYADETDLLNTWRAERANFFNAQEWQNTQAWNKYMWDLENEYNSPSQVMQRYIEAGINPIWAISGAPQSQASSLQADMPHPTQYSPATYDLASLANQRDIANSTNAVNSMLGLGNLNLGEKRLALDTFVSKSSIKETKARTALLNSQLESNEFLNKINSDTYETQVRLRQAELDQTRQNIENLRAQKDLTDKQKDLLSAEEDKEKALKLQIEAATKKIESETFSQIDNLRFRWFQAATARISANASATQADAAVEANRINDAQLNHMIEKDEAELELKSNEQILSIIDNQRGVVDRFLGTSSNFISTVTGGKDFELVNRTISYMKAGLKVLSKRVYTNPTKANINAYNSMVQKITDFQNQRISLPGVVPSVQDDPSVSNPSGSDW